MDNKKSRLKQKYEKEIIPQLLKEFGVNNAMAVSRIEKVVVNLGSGEIAKNDQLRQSLMSDLSKITGQMPSIRRAKLSIASFNVIKGNPVGLTTTLRGERMYSFLDRLISVVLPRLRDFRGIPLKSFDNSGNYTLGIIEHTIFPEIDLTKSGNAKGLEITIVIKGGDLKQKRKLLELMGMPFEKIS